MTPESHQTKNDTPTMGGLFVISIFAINVLMWSNLTKLNVWLILLCTLSFGLIGFLDDAQKIWYKKGIPAKLKFRLQFLAAFILSCAWYFLCTPDSRICIPFFKNFMPDIGFLLIPWATFIIVATSNAVNLTDGLDGLATGPLLFNFSTFAMIAYLAGHVKFANYLFIPFAGSAELTILAMALIGSLLGFLWYNTYPAQIFMGDVGSLALGAGLAFMALITRQEILLMISGGIFVAETLSVILQVASFKLRGKRIFLMAPIHHHFELLGWKEAKITVRFWIVSIILCVLALLTLKIR
jgi:phospho-N-acetylmuramoyl-pentapeptide-transferase